MSARRWADVADCNLIVHGVPTLARHIASPREGPYVRVPGDGPTWWNAAQENLNDNL